MMIKNLLFTTSFVLLSVLCHAQAEYLYATQFKTDGGVLLSTQNLSAPKDSKASSIVFFTENEENPTAYYPFGDISNIGDDFDTPLFFR